jgi:hypothetical protein
VGDRFARYWLLLPLLGGAALLVLSEFLVLREIRAITAVPPGGTTRAGGHHGYALLVVGVALVPMAWGAVVGGSRPAAFACLALALVAVGIVLAVDRPALDDTGLIGRTYDLAEASPKAAFWTESIGAALALIGGIGAVVLRPSGRASRARARPRGARAPRPRAPAAASPPREDAGGPPAPAG